MENALIANDVNNVAKGRPNMSFKYTDDRQVMHGYILADEDRLNQKGDAIIYVYDLASDGNVRAGGSLILGFTEAYKRNCIAQKKFMPIYAQMRDKTSYSIITQQLDKLVKGTGVSFTIEDLDSYQGGTDMMHQVMMRPITQAE